MPHITTKSLPLRAPSAWLMATGLVLAALTALLALGRHDGVPALPRLSLETQAAGDDIVGSIHRRHHHHASLRHRSRAGKRHAEARKKKHTVRIWKDSQDMMDGMASFYVDDSKTASGEPFDNDAMAAAHRTLPFGTQVRVTDQDTGHSIMVRINDRGPYVEGRCIDLTSAAAEKLGISKERGLAKVKLEVVDQAADLGVAADLGRPGKTQLE